jgi:hypothetical protein
MIPKATKVDNDQASEHLKPVDVNDKPATPATNPSPLRPNLLRALNASWERNEEAYRYLGQ